MNFYTGLTDTQVFNTHMLLKFLRRLRVVYAAHTDVTKIPLTEFGKPNRYTIRGITFSEGVYKTREDYLDDLIQEGQRLRLYDP